MRKELKINNEKLVTNFFNCFNNFNYFTDSTIYLGIETNKFNKLISDKAYQSKSINLELSTISFKLDPKELSLFLETQYPKIIYKDISFL